MINCLFEYNPSSRIKATIDQKIRLKLTIYCQNILNEGQSDIQTSFRKAKQNHFLG